MNKIFLSLILFSFISGCGPVPTRVISGPKGDPGIPGAPGQDGHNGHSLITLSPGTLPIICTSGGSAIDLYLDVNDDLTVGVDDLYQSTVFACNGNNGADGQDGDDGQDGATGPQGPQGPAGSSGTMVATNFPSDTTCRSIGGSYYAKKQTSSGDTIRTYISSDCSGSYIQSMTSSVNEVWWTSPTNGFYVEGVNASGMVIYRFSL